MKKVICNKKGTKKCNDVHESMICVCPHSVLHGVDETDEDDCTTNKVKCGARVKSRCKEAVF